MKISVVMPVYNRGGMVGAAVESLRRQTFADFEIVAVDDGSTDDTVAALEALGEPRLRVVAMGRNTGIPIARNAGLAAAVGDYVAILDSDDISLPERLGSQAAFLDRHPEVAMVASLSEEMRADGRATGKVKRRPLGADAMRAHALFRCPVLQSTVMARRAVLERFPYDPAFPVCSDYEMFGRLAWAHPCCTLPRVLVRRRVHPGSISREKFELTRERNLAVIRARLEAIGLAPDRADLSNQYAIGHLNKGEVSAGPELLDWAQDWLPKLRAAALAAGLAAADLDAQLGAIWLKACLRCGGKRQIAALPGIGLAAARSFLAERFRR